MRHYHAVIVVVFYLIEKRHAIVSRETLFVGKEYAGVGVCRLIGHRNLRYVGFQPDNHRLVGKSEAFHFVRCNAHYQRFTRAHLVVGYSAAVHFQHQYTILLRGVNGMYVVHIGKCPHIEVGKCLV